jgi:Zn-dependent M28 family amino/carboxypeptidase
MQIKKYFNLTLVPALLCTIVLGTGYLVNRLSQPLWSPVSITVNAQAASSASLERHVRALSIDYANRSFENIARLSGAARYIEAEFTALGLAVESQVFTVDNEKFKNLIVRLGPDTPEVLVVGAHYDVAGEQPGADDNASGVAGLIELARLLKDAPLTQRVELVAYTNEEPPFFRTESMGSAVHAKALKASGKRASLMLSLECIGYFNDAPGSQTHPVRLLNAVYPTVGNFIALVGYYEDGETARKVKTAMMTATDLPVHSINAPGFVVGIDFSDHLNYAAEGFVGMMVTDTAFYRNKAYHTPQDTADRLDYVRMGKVVDGVHKAVRVHAANQAPV